jgi:hypothetical protein
LFDPSFRPFFCNLVEEGEQELEVLQVRVPHYLVGGGGEGGAGGGGSSKSGSLFYGAMQKIRPFYVTSGIKPQS